MKNYIGYLNETKLNKKYGFFMFLDAIDHMKNSFVNKDYLNTKNFNIFFKTDNIKDKQKLTDFLEFKMSLNVAYQTFIHIRNLRLSFYFGVRNYFLEYGFLDDKKNTVYKVGEFKINSNFLKTIIDSYKSFVLISKVLSEIKLKDLITLQNIKNDLRYLFDVKFNEIQIRDNDKVIKKIDNIELKNYYKGNDDIRLFFDEWCFNYKWYYTTYNYIDNDNNYTYFIVKIKNTDTDLNFLKKNFDIKRISENNEESSSFVDQTPRTNVVDPMTTEPLNAPQLKVLNKNLSKNTNIDKEKELIKYFKDLKRILLKLSKDVTKNKSYITNHLYPLVGKYQKPFNDIKKDLYWLQDKLSNNMNFIEGEENKLKRKMDRQKIKNKKNKNKK